jgi:hypothetical protein
MEACSQVEAEADETEVIVQPTAGRPAATSVESEEKAGRSGSGIFSSSPRTDPEDIEANTSEWYHPTALLSRACAAVRCCVCVRVRWCVCVRAVGITATQSARE